MNRNSPASGRAHPLSRREFLHLAALGAAGVPVASAELRGPWTHPRQEVEAVDRPWVLRDANRYLHRSPRTITSVPALRSAGGLHDFFSEGDYWWPDPKNPNAPYIRRDGESNPDNFVAHRDLLMRLSIQMPVLTAAWVLTGRGHFADHAAAHLRAWFVDPATRMNPNLEYAQAIHGIDTGRSIGIIDTVHLVEVAQAALILTQRHAIDPATEQGTRQWFTEYLNWLTASDRGLQERAARNNHGSCWLLQAAEFATFIGDNSVRDACRDRLKNTLVPNQIAPNGSFPLELARTKPYSYSLFNLDILGMCARVLSDPKDDLWTWRPSSRAGLESSFAFMIPYIESKTRWPYRHDVEYFDDLPVRQPSLLFAGLAYHRPEYLRLWQRLNPEPTVPEIIRNHPVRQPILWMQS